MKMKQPMLNKLKDVFRLPASARHTVIYLAIFFITILFLVFAYYLYPYPTGDSAYFIPTAINFASGEGLVNKMLGLFSVSDPSGMGKFLILPPLFPLALAWFMPHVSPQGALLVIVAMIFLILLMEALVLMKIVSFKIGRVRWRDTAIILLFLLAIATSNLYYLGRPETLAMLFSVIALLLCARFYRRTAVMIVSLGCAGGLMMATNIGPAVLFLALIGVFFGVIEKLPKAIFSIGAAYLVAFIAFLAVMQLSPYGTAETITGVRDHLAFNRSGIQSVEAYLSTAHADVSPIQSIFNIELIRQFYLPDVLFPSSPRELIGPSDFIVRVLLLLIFVAAFLLYRRHKEDINSRILVFAFAGVFLIFAFVFGNPSYTFTLSPIFFALLLYYYLTTSARLDILRGATILLTALISFGLVISVLTLFLYLRHGTTAQEARALVGEVLAGSHREKEGVIGIVPTMWPLFDNYEGIYAFTGKAGFGLNSPKIHTFFLKENFNGITNPPAWMGNCKLSRDLFSYQQPKVLNVRIGNAMPGYQFAAYECP